MLTLDSSRRYYLYRAPADMRKGFNGLSGLVRDGMQGDPLSGVVYIFVNRKRDRLKLLLWDTTGFVIWYKRLERGTFELPETKNGVSSALIPRETLLLMLEGIELKSVPKRKRYRHLKVAQ